MKLFACIKKDIRLLTGGGIKSLLFPFVPILLVFLMFLGMGSLSEKRSYIEPFPIAVRDEDDTILTRIAVNILSELDVFSEVMDGEGETDEELCSRGCAVVLSIPEGYFYDLYYMLDTDVRVVLNSDMPTEAAIVKSALLSILDIINQNQRVYYSAGLVKYGEMSYENYCTVLDEYSDNLIYDCLSRLDYFDLATGLASSINSSRLFFASGICSMLLMFIPLCVFRSVPEEYDLGILPRFRAAGGSHFTLLVSKFITAFSVAAIPVLLLLIILGTGEMPKTLLILFILFLVSCAFFGMLLSLARSSARSQLLGNIIIILMLVLGGALYPYELMPEFLQSLSRFSLPYYSLQGMYLAAMGSSISDILSLLLPAICAGAVFTIITLLGVKLRRRA